MTPARILAFALCLALGGLIGVGVAGLNMVGALTWETVLLIVGAVAGCAVLLGFVLVIGMVGHGKELDQMAEDVRERQHG